MSLNNQKSHHWWKFGDWARNVSRSAIDWMVVKDKAE